MEGMQKGFCQSGDFKKIPALLADYGVSSLLIVQGKGRKFEPFHEMVENLPLKTQVFSDFSPNPKTQEVEKALSLFQQEGCDGILAVGGGSALDVAKAVKAYGHKSPPYDFHQLADCGKIPLFAVPTTGGTGSESTDFAVVYENQVKLSLYHPDLLPEVYVLEPGFLASLPLYQKKATFLDALCQGIESYWAKSATAESKAWAKQGITLLLSQAEGYFAQEDATYESILLGANYCGKAIQLSKTTAPHAMSYGLGQACHIPHGHGVALCLAQIWPWMVANKMPVSVAEALAQLEEMTLFPKGKGVAGFLAFLQDMDLPSLRFDPDYPWKTLCQSVNVARLSNHPVALSQDCIEKFYHNIRRGIG